MKKTIALLLIAVMTVSLLVACGNPVADDFDNFINSAMTEVNENYSQIKTEAANWSNLTEEEDVISSLTDVLLPLIDDSLAKLEEINPETDEVKALKAIYVEMMETFKEGFEEIYEGYLEGDSAKQVEGMEKISAGYNLYTDYNSAVEEVAEANGFKAE